MFQATIIYLFRDQLAADCGILKLIKSAVLQHEALIVHPLLEQFLELVKNSQTFSLEKEERKLLLTSNPLLHFFIFQDLKSFGLEQSYQLLSQRADLRKIFFQTLMENFHDI